MVAVAQLVERQIVVLAAAGSSPVGHPSITRDLISGFWYNKNMKDDSQLAKNLYDKQFNRYSKKRKQRVNEHRIYGKNLQVAW